MEKASGKIRGRYDGLASAQRALPATRLDQLTRQADCLVLPNERMLMPRYADTFDPDESYAGKANRPIIVTLASNPILFTKCIPGYDMLLRWSGASKAAVEGAVAHGRLIDGRFYARRLDYLGQHFAEGCWTLQAPQTLEWCSMGRWRRDFEKGLIKPPPSGRPSNR